MDHVARVIHEVDEAGNVVRIGWEPAASIHDRSKAVNGTVRLMERLSTVLAQLHYWAAEDDGIRQFYESKPLVEVRESLMDLRPLMMAFHRSYNAGIALPRWETAPQSKRYYRRAS